MPLETVKKWRQRDNGPPFHIEGRSVYYLKREVSHWQCACGECFTGTTYGVTIPRSYDRRLCEGFAMLDNDND